MIEPKVTIGLPVYNGERTIEVAIQTLLKQSFHDFVLIISDNCSTDSTSEICRNYAAIDKRIKYFRQQRNLGAEKNFQFLLQKSQSEYFMWASADDIRSPDFIELNLTFLEANLEYVSSTCPTRFEDSDFDEVRMGDSSLDGAPEDRFLAFFSTWHANGRFCGLFRRVVLLENYRIERPFLGCDWTVILRCCMAGKMHRCDSGWIEFGAHGISRKNNIFKVYRNHWGEHFAPFAKLTIEVYKMTRHFSLKTRLRLARILINFNIAAIIAKNTLSRTSKLSPP